MESSRSSEGKGRRGIGTLAAVTAGTLGLLGQAAAQDIDIGPHRGRFTDVRPVMELNTGDVEWVPSLTEDGLLVVFSRGPDSSAPHDLWTAEREDRSEKFGEPTLLASLNTDANDSFPRISPDGLKIVFTSNRPGGQGSSDIYFADREDRRDDFNAPVNLGSAINTELNDSPGQFPDGLRLYLNRSRAGDHATHHDLFVATRPNDEVWWDSDEVTVEPVVDVNTADYGEQCPSVSSDGQVLFFGEWLPVNPAGPGSADIWFAPRLGPGPADFGNPTLLPFPVNTSEPDMTPWISYDWPAEGSELWFTRCGNNPNCSETDIWVATWEPCVPPPAPENLRLFAVEPTSIELEWDWDGVPSDETSFEIERQDPGGFVMVAGGLTSDTRRYLDEGLTPERDYVYRVSAVGCDSTAPSADLTVSTLPPPGGAQMPADCDQNGRIELTDGVCLLRHLFAGMPAALPCGPETQAPANLALLDMDSSGRLDLTDGVKIFQYLFSGGPPPPLCADASCGECVSIEGCPDNSAACP